MPTLLPIYGGADTGPRPETRAQVHGALTRGVDPVTVADHAARGVDEMSAALDRMEIPGEPKPACHKGCFHCCHQRVELTAAEVFLLARHLRVHAGEAVMRRIRETDATLAGLSSREHHLRQVRCALLDEEGGCSAYASRPIACRRAHSTDADVCAAAHLDPTLAVRIPDAPTRSWNLSALVLGYYEGAAHAGFPPHVHELHAALALALADPDTEARFAAGEDLLAPARTRTADEIPLVLGRADGDPTGDRC